MTLEVGRRLIGGIWRTGSRDEPDAGGGSQPVQATYSQSGVTSIPDGQSAGLSFTTLDSGTDLLDRVDQEAAPTFLADGVYAVSVTIFAPTPLTSGGYMVATVGGAVFAISEDSYHPDSNVTLSGTAIADAGDLLSVTVLNHDGAATRDFTMTNATIVLLPGTVGAQGDPGVQGDPGDPGVGVPTGGSTGEVLAKASNANYDTEWTPSGGGGGGNFQVADFTFTEETTAGTYTATLPIPARAFVVATGYWLEGDWAADTADLTIGDEGGAWIENQSVLSGTAFQWNDVAEAFNGHRSYVSPEFGGPYGTSKTVTMEIVTTIGSPPVVPTGIVRVRVFYCTVPSPTAATFA